MQLPESYKSLQGYLGADGRFKIMPGKRQKKLQILLFQFLSEQFEKDVQYLETEVNSILNNCHSFEDPASLRRFMIGQKLLARTLDGRVYWKV